MWFSLVYSWLPENVSRILKINLWILSLKKIPSGSQSQTTWQSHSCCRDPRGVSPASLGSWCSTCSWSSPVPKECLGPTFTTHMGRGLFRGTFSLAHQQTSWQADHELDARVGAAYKRFHLHNFYLFVGFFLFGWLVCVFWKSMKHLVFKIIWYSIHYCRSGKHWVAVSLS